MNLTKSTYIFPGKGGKLRVDCSAADRIKTKAKLPNKFRIFPRITPPFMLLFLPIVANLPLI